MRCALSPASTRSKSMPFWAMNTARWPVAVHRESREGSKSVERRQRPSAAAGKVKDRRSQTDDILRAKWPTRANGEPMLEAPARPAERLGQRSPANAASGDRRPVIDGGLLTAVCVLNVAASRWGDWRDL